MLNREIEKVDLIVIGGGTAGFGAAIAAARKGLKVTVLEAGEKIGGVMSDCPGMPFGGGFPIKKSIGGIFEELIQRLFIMEPPMAERRDCSLEEFGDEVIYDHDAAITEMYKMLDEIGVRVLLNSTAIEPLMNGNRIEGIAYSDKNGINKLYANFVIDCSGEGDISAKAGVPFEKGDIRGNMMGVTMTFIMRDADWEKIFDNNPDPYFTKYAEKGIKEGKIHQNLFKLYIMKAFHKNTVYFNSIHIPNVDGTNLTDVRKAEQEARKQCVELSKFVKEEIPGFENSQMIYLGPTVGIRETRKFEGVYRITAEDIALGNKFIDGIVCCDNPIDDVMRGSNIMTHNHAVKEKGMYYRIPFRCFVPKKIENLLFAGKIISADPTAFASVRGMPQCILMGQACGTAAGIALKNKIIIQDIENDILIKELQKSGVKGLGKTKL